MVKPHHDVCRITDKALTRTGLAYELGQEAFLYNMLSETKTTKPNPFREPALASAWRSGFSMEYADHQTAMTHGVKLIGFDRRKK